MRAAIRTKLVGWVSAVGSRVYEPHMAGPTIDKPYIVVKMGGEDSSMNKNCYDLPVEVWVYEDRTNFVALDALCNTVIGVLKGKDLTTTGGQTFSLEYGGSGEDYYDDDWKALTRQLRFSTVRVREG